VAVSIVSITLNPLLSRLVSPLERWATSRTRFWRRAMPGDVDAGAASSLDPLDRAVVVGYGPTGRTVTRLLRDNGISPTVVELNMDTVRALRQDGTSAVYGDARHADTLIIAGLRHAGTFIVSGADTGAPETIRAARELNPDVQVFVRAGYLRDVPALRAAGAQEVFSGEGEVALAMTEAVLQRLGATADQIDRERQRVHEALFGSSAPPPAPRARPAADV
jgi:monovalent cation:H+ antiporter-2, CPA2 family